MRRVTPPWFHADAAASFGRVTVDRGRLRPRLHPVETLAPVALLVALVALVMSVIVLRRDGGRRRRSGAEALPEDVHGLRQEVAALRAEAKDALRHLAVVRYDAFGDMGGHLSWSLALVDDGGNGVVLTSIHGRSDARSYAKNLLGWTGEQPLSPEEEAAVAQARAGGRSGVPLART